MTSDSASTFEGGCTCRAVRYRMTSTPLFVHCCHCRWCQRETGSAFALNALIEADRVMLLKGKGQTIARCPSCRIALWSTYGGSELVRFVRVATLDEPQLYPPDIHIYTSSKLPWVALPAGTPAVPEYYRSSEVWPADALARRRALFG